MEWIEKIVRQDPNDARLRFLTSSEKAAQKIHRARLDWAENLQVPNKKAMLFEFEMLLLGIQRYFFDFRSKKGDSLPLITKNFKPDLEILHESLSKVFALTTRFLLANDQRVSFRQFVEGAHGKGFSGKDESPMEDEPSVVDSLYQLNASHKAFVAILESLMTCPMVSLASFESLGFLMTRDLQSNAHFNPRHFEQFTPLYDKIHSEAVQKVIKSIKDDEVRHVTSVVLLVFFRTLNYLRFIPRPCAESKLVKKSMVILSIISTEIKNLQQFLHEGPQLLVAVEGAGTASNALRKKMVDALFWMARVLRDEHERVFNQELENFSFSVDRINRVTSSIDICHVVLTNLCHQCVVRCLHVFDGTIDGQNIFDNFIPPVDVARKLRQDLILFDDMLDNFEKALRGEDKTLRIAPIFRSILDFTAYFESVEFQALRLGDYGQFRQFTAMIWKVNEGLRERRSNKQDVVLFKKQLSEFRPILKNTIRGIGHRAELKNIPVKPEENKAILEKYLGQIQATTKRQVDYS